MQDNKNNLDDLFRKSLGELKEDVPTETEWTQMRGRMVEEKLLSGKNRKKRFLIFFCSVFVGLSSLLVFMNKEKTSVATLASNDKNNSAEKNKTLIENSNTEIRSTKSPVAKQKINTAKVSSRDKVKDKKINTASYKKANTEKAYTQQKINSTKVSSRDKVKDKKINTPSYKKANTEKAYYTLNETHTTQEPTVKSRKKETAFSKKKDGNKTEIIKNKKQEGALVASASNAKSDDEPSSSQITFQNSNEQQKTIPNTNEIIISNEGETIVENKTNNGSLTEPNSSISPTAIPAPTIETVAELKTAEAPVEAAKIEAASLNASPEMEFYVKGYKAKTDSKWSIGPYLSLDYDWYALKTDYANGKEMLASANSSQLKGNKKVHYTAGVILNYRFSKKNSIETGALFSQKTKVNAYMPSIGYMESTAAWSFNDYTFAYNGKYLAIPLWFKRYIIDKQFKIYSLVGATSVFNILGGSNYFVSENYSSAGSSRDKVFMKMSSMGVSGRIAIGFEMNISGNWNFYAEPFYEHSFNPLVKDPAYQLPIDHFYRTIGIGGGLLYHFSKKSSSAGSESDGCDVYPNRNNQNK